MTLVKNSCRWATLWRVGRYISHLLKFSSITSKLNLSPSTTLGGQKARLRAARGSIQAIVAKITGYNASVSDSFITRKHRTAKEDLSPDRELSRHDTGKLMVSALSPSSSSFMMTYTILYSGTSYVKATHLCVVSCIKRTSDLDSSSLILYPHSS